MPLPWFVYGVYKGVSVEVRAKTLTSSIFTLVFMLMLVVLTIIYFKWRMTKSMGYMMFFMYLIFLSLDICKQLPKKSDGGPILDFGY